MKKIVLLGLTLAIFTITVSAQRGRDGIREHRVEKGFHSGELTRGEKFKLKKNRHEFNKTKRHAYRDGKLSRFEKRKLTKMRKQDRRQVYRYKHNGRKRVI